MTNDGQATLSGIYQNIRSNRQIRRSFITNLLRLFSEESAEKVSLEERIFVADNIAMFPYQVGHFVSSIKRAEERHLASIDFNERN